MNPKLNCMSISKLSASLLLGIILMSTSAFCSPLSSSRCKTYSYDFNGSTLNNHWTITTSCPGGIRLVNGVLKTKLVNTGGQWLCGPTISFNRDFQYGEFEMRLKTAGRPGVVTAFVLRSSDFKGDEIDFEWVGKKPSQVQTNWFINGIAIPGTARFHNLNINMAKGFHTYKIVWKRDYVKWYMNGKLIRTLNRQKQFPTKTSRVFFGVWDASGIAGGKWAGVVNKSKGPYEAEWDQFKYKICK